MRKRPHAYLETDWTWASDSNNNNDAIVTVNHAAGCRTVVPEIYAGFSDFPANSKNLTITDGTTTLYFPISTGECKHITLEKPFWAAENTNVTVTLPASGTAGVYGYLNVCYG